MITRRTFFGRQSRDTRAARVSLKRGQYTQVARLAREAEDEQGATVGGTAHEVIPAVDSSVWSDFGNRLCGDDR